MPTSTETPAEAETGASLDAWDLARSWHPFTQMREYAAIPPVHIARGEGNWLYDTRGRRYFDGNASVWANVHGHGDPDLDAALKEQLGRVAHSTYLGLSHPAGARLGERLCAAAPAGIERAVFSDNGSNAVEIALKLSFQYWQLVGQPRRRLVACLSGAYHGDTFGAMAAGDCRGFHGRFAPWLFERRVVPAPDHVELAGRVRRSSMAESLETLERLLETEGDQLAAFILEPSVQGAAGMRQQPEPFLREAARLCRRTGVHLILDEVFVGFGRLGSLFVCREQGVEPDFLCLAKGLTAGYLPLAATLTTREVYEAFLGDFESGRGFYHGHTFAANPLAAAVALKSLEKLEPLLASGGVAAGAERLGRRLAEAFEGHPNVAEARQRGLAAAIDLRPAAGQSPWRPNDRMGMRACLEARRRGLLLRPLGDTVLVVPPIASAEEEIDYLVERLREALEAAVAAREKGP